ncbi:MAG TPA: cupin domain-containing protein [Albitalea sp.]|jgi:hypothetical protein|nr:cupin domain-containing protein [Albitalea sp.]
MKRDAAALPVPGGLRSRLLARVDASHRHERQFLTVRGGGDRLLARTGVASSWCIPLAPGAALPRDGAADHDELVVLAGDVLVEGRRLGCGDAVAAPSTRMQALRAGAGGACIYLRRSRGTSCAPGFVVIDTLDERGWDLFCPGVQIRELASVGERRSVLVRMQAGANVNAHGHALEEECMMLAGEAFVGDTLLRSGDYQLAPAGSRHGAISTDVGALFFVNGSLDPAAYA